MADFQNNKPPRIKNVLDNPKLKLTAPTPGVQGKKANLVWGFYEHNAPRITVYTGDPNDQDQRNDYGKIHAKMDVRAFVGLILLIKRAAAHDHTKGEYREVIENMNFTFFNRQRSATSEVVSKTIVGKDKDGVVWLSVSAKNRPQIKFEFGSNEFHNFVHGDGSPWTKAEFSSLDAEGYAGLLEDLMALMMYNNVTFPEPKGDQQQRGGGGGQGAPAAPRETADIAGGDIPW